MRHAIYCKVIIEMIALYHFLATKVTKEIIFDSWVRITRTQKKISLIQRIVSLLYGSRKNFFDFNIISLIETSFFFNQINLSFD